MGRRIRYRPGYSQDQLATFGGARPNTFWTSQTILTIAAVWGLVLIGIVGAGYWLMQNRKFQSEFAPLLDVCQGKRVNVSSTYAATVGKHPAVSVISAQLDTEFIPGGLVAPSLAETQVVLCMGAVQKIFIESCPYTTDGGSQATNSLERYYLRQDAKLIEAKTGRVIAIQSFTGKSPRYCHETELLNKNKRVEQLTGTDISTNDVERWVQTYLFIE
jgi:hypothetical protein